jgi:hypothetical protein
MSHPSSSSNLDDVGKQASLSPSNDLATPSTQSPSPAKPPHLSHQWTGSVIPDTVSVSFTPYGSNSDWSTLNPRTPLSPPSLYHPSHSATASFTLPCPARLKLIAHRLYAGNGPVTPATGFSSLRKPCTSDAHCKAILIKRHKRCCHISGSPFGARNAAVCDV